MFRFLPVLGTRNVWIILSPLLNFLFVFCVCWFFGPGFRKGGIPCILKTQIINLSTCSLHKDHDHYNKNSTHDQCVHKSSLLILGLWSLYMGKLYVSYEFVFYHGVLKSVLSEGSYCWELDGNVFPSEWRTV